MKFRSCSKTQISQNQRKQLESSLISSSFHLPSFFTPWPPPLVPDPGHRCPCIFCYSSSPLRTGSDPNLETRWNLDSGQLGMGVHAGVTLLAPATNPERPSLTTLSKIPPPPLWVTLSTPLFCTIFLHSTYHHLELCTCFLGYFLSPQENTNDMRAGTLSPTSNSICWLHEWSHSV